MKFKLSQLNVFLGVVGLAMLALVLLREPQLMLLALTMILPGFLLTYYFSETGFSFLERIGLSIAVSNIFLVVPRALTTLGVGFGKTGFILVVFIVPLLIGLAKYRAIREDARRLKKAIYEGDYSKIGYALFIICLCLFLTWLFWGSLLQGVKLPLTDQVMQQAFITTYKNTIEGYGRYPYWASEYSGGFPLVLFDSPFYYERVAFNWMLLGNTATLQLNLYSFMNLALLLLGIYCLARRLGFGKIAAIFAMIMFIVSPLLGSKLGYSGDMKEMTSFAILPFLILILLQALDKKDKGVFALLGVLLASYYFTNLVPLIASIMMIGFYVILRKIVMKETIKREEILGFGLCGIVVVGIIALNLVPMALSLRYGTPESWNFDYGKSPQIFYDNILRPMFSEPITKPVGQYSHNLGLFFTIMALLGMGLSLREFRRDENFLLLGFWLMLFSYFVPLLNIPLQRVESHRLVLLILMMFSLFIGRLFDMPKKTIFKFGVVALFIALIASYAPIAITESNNWVNEQAQNGLFSEVYKALEQLGPGRVINYGIFAYATEPNIPAISKLWMITHTSMVGARTIPQYELKDGSESALNKEHNLAYIINRMRTTFTRYIIVVKDPSREGDKTYAALRGYLPNSSMIYDSAQLAIFVVPDSYYIQSVLPAKSPLSREEIYSSPEGWKFFGFKALMADDDYGIAVNSVEDISKLPYPSVYDYQIVSPGDFNIYGNFTGGWIVVKDHYFPTWHAQMDGKDLRIEESNLGTVLIKTEPGSTIHLYHKPYWYEPLLSLVAISFIFGIFLLLFFLRDNKPEGSKQK